MFVYILEQNERSSLLKRWPYFQVPVRFSKLSVLQVTKHDLEHSKS